MDTSTTGTQSGIVSKCAVYDLEDEPLLMKMKDSSIERVRESQPLRESHLELSAQEAIRFIEWQRYD